MPDRMKRARDVIWREIDDDVVIIKEDGTELITLNSTAAFIWKQCDGERDAGDIAAMLEEQYTAGFDEIYTDVVAAQTRLENAGLLEKADG